MNTYSWNAADYAQHSQAQQTWARELITTLHLSANEDVLDLGCGDGKVTAELAAYVGKGSVLGVDSSSAMVELARQHYPTSRYPNLTFAQVDARQLAFTGQFDVVFSNAALHWVKDHQPVVDGIYQSLKPGGRILLQMGGKGNAAGILSVVQEIQTEPPWQAYFADFDFPYGFYGTEDYETFLHDAGFQIERLGLIPKDMQHAGQRGLEGWIRTTWLPYTDRVPLEKRDDFIHTIAERYLAQVPLDAEGIAHVAMVRIEAAAVKPG